MNAKPRWPSPYRLLAAAVLCAIAAAAYTGWRARRDFFDPALLLSRFPAEEAAVVDIDFASLRNAGLFSASGMAAEPEYRAFSTATGFDYRRDLEQVTAAFSASGNYFIARGRFDWPKLRAYAASHGGSCAAELCRLEGSAPERRISFLPLQSGVIAMAVSRDPSAAMRLTYTGQRVTALLPDAPAWISFPGALLKSPGVLPPGVRVMLSAMANSDRILITVTPSGEGIEARLETTCRSVDDARVLSSQLRVMAGSLKSAQNDDIARTISAGTFTQRDRVVTGRWPLPKSALDALAGAI